MKVVVHGLTKKFITGQGKTRALSGIDLEMRDREFFGIIGPTGCDKTGRPPDFRRKASYDGVD